MYTFIFIDIYIYMCMFNSSVCILYICTFVYLIYQCSSLKQVSGLKWFSWNVKEQIHTNTHTHKPCAGIWVAAAGATRQLIHPISKISSNKQFYIQYVKRVSKHSLTSNMENTTRKQTLHPVRESVWKGKFGIQYVKHFQNVVHPICANSCNCVSIIFKSQFQTCLDQFQKRFTHPFVRARCWENYISSFTCIFLKVMNR